MLPGIVPVSILKPIKCGEGSSLGERDFIADAWRMRIRSWIGQGDAAGWSMGRRLAKDSGPPVSNIYAILWKQGSNGTVSTSQLSARTFVFHDNSAIHQIDAPVAARSLRH